MVAVDLNADKLAMARDFGATDTVNAGDEDAVKQVRALTGGGVDHAFEMVGSAKALEMAYRITRRGGQTVTAGLPHPDARMPLNALQLVAEERSLRGSYMSHPGR